MSNSSDIQPAGLASGKAASRPLAGAYTIASTRRPAACGSALICWRESEALAHLRLYEVHAPDVATYSRRGRRPCRALISTIRGPARRALALDVQHAAAQPERLDRLGPPVDEPADLAWSWSAGQCRPVS